MEKITVNRKGKSLTRTELRHRYLPLKLPRFLRVILDGVFQSFMPIEKTFSTLAITSLDGRD